LKTIGVIRTISIVMYIDYFVTSKVANNCTQGQDYAMSCSPIALPKSVQND
jgi:hypothetical protein